MQRFCHRAGVGIVSWRQGASADAVSTLAPRDHHRRIVTRARHGRVAVGYAATGLSTVTADLADNYNLQGTVGADAAASYAVRGLVSADVSVSYRLRVAVASDLSATYEVLSGSSVQSALVSVYNVRASVAASLSCVYSLGDIAITGPGRARIGSAVLNKARRHITFKAPSKRIGAPTL